MVTSGERTVKMVSVGWEVAGGDVELIDTNYSWDGCVNDVGDDDDDLWDRLNDI